jgi:hypothetical protein
MESVVRGRVEKELDRLLMPEVINMIVRISKNLPLKSVQDFCFGYIVGDIIVGTFEEVRARYGREPTSDELNETLNMISRRTMEIKGAVKFSLGK